MRPTDFGVNSLITNKLGYSRSDFSHSKTLWGFRKP